MVKELREATGAGVLDAKKALEAHEGNFDKAVDFLREKGLARAATRADRVAQEGIVEVYSHPGSRMAVIMELNCETDFVARNEMFRTLAHDLAVHIAAARPRYLRPEEVPQAELDRELDVLRSQARAEGKPEQVIEKIVTGRLAKFYEEICLLEQPFVKDEKVKIKDMIADAMRTTGENIVLRRFQRYELGEAL
jgi:elongation factor Ts